MRNPSVWTDVQVGMRPRVVGVITATIFVLAGCGSEIVGGAGGESAGSWERLPDPPVSPRQNAVTVGLGERVLVVGGSDAQPCASGAECVVPDVPSLADGAIYDGRSDQWQRIADAPLPIEWAHTAVIGSTVYMWVPDTGRPDSHLAFLEYDTGEDEWAKLPLPPHAENGYCCLIAAAGDVIVAYPSSDEQGEIPDHLFEPETGEWTEVPADPLSPAFDREMVWSGAELILFAKELVPQPGSERPSLSQVAALDLGAREWRALPETGSLGGGGALVDGRIVNPRLGWADGGEVNNWGREYPYGGVLDPNSGEWTELPEAPDGQDEVGAGLYAGGEAHYVNDSGWVLDLQAGEWGRIEPRPGSSDEPGGPVTQGDGVSALGESLFVFGGVRWDDWEDSDPEWLDEAWLWSP